ncbi:large conductance mechanosensitive channel protein MscL [Croceicoccus sp. BE223]|uniref:large conductance mechanosensitive channel protein MscL n=1 Tax=Croceicoccus sp. BE223 TaxID=2817716 RepID=UPI00285C9646|nr:large conductance mechanosensitive channel protein MscL [Croceicoccus sp. BE223]MDR7101074.1 large conductance mechanosensitive channel [Croceicoccus sp. BE223]
MFAEFRKFIARGNVLDLAVGVIIGAAFGKITTSLTESILMPLIGAVFGSVDFSNKFIQLGPVPAGYDGARDNYAALKESGVPMIGYGDLITQCLNFVIIAFALFLLVRGVNRVIEAAERDKQASAPEAPVDATLETLKEILAELKKRD